MLGKCWASGLHGGQKRGRRRGGVNSSPLRGKNEDWVSFAGQGIRLPSLIEPVLKAGVERASIPQRRWIIPRLTHLDVLPSQGLVGLNARRNQQHQNDGSHNGQL